MKAQLLCAGLGTRFRPLTEKLAKPALPFLNLPQLAYSLYHVEKLGERTSLDGLVINTHHLPKTIESAFASLGPKRYSTHFSHEPQILGSGGGIKNNKAHLESDHFVVVNGDEIILFNHDRSFLPLLEHHQKSGALATLLTTRHPEAGRTLGGVWADANGQISKLGGTDIARADAAQHFTGVFVFSRRVFDYMPAAESNFHIFSQCLEPAIRRGEKVLAYHDPNLLWLEATDLKSYMQSTERALIEMGQNSVYGQELLRIFAHFGRDYERIQQNQWLAQGAKFEGSISAESFLLMDRNSLISPAVDVHGFAVLGRNARVMQGVVDCSVVAADVHINEMTSLRGQLIV
jgi:NDP-sugar pyrophosphorylase family protein